MGWMRITCRDAARWMSLRRDEPLGAWQQLALKLHLHVCGDCREIDRQLEQVGRLGHDLFARGLGDDPPPPQKPPPQR
jgi:hypothetical protein